MQLVAQGYIRWPFFALRGRVGAGLLLFAKKRSSFPSNIFICSIYLTCAWKCTRTFWRDCTGQRQVAEQPTSPAWRSSKTDCRCGWRRRTSCGWRSDASERHAPSAKSCGCSHPVHGSMQRIDGHGSVVRRVDRLCVWCLFGASCDPSRRILF